MCGFANDHCVIGFRLAATPPHIFAYTTAVQTPRRPLKRDPEGKIKNIRAHVCWVTDASHHRSSATTNIAQTLEYVDPADLISLGGEKFSGFAWKRVPESFMASSSECTTQNDAQDLIFTHSIGDADGPNLFGVPRPLFKRLLLD